MYIYIYINDTNGDFWWQKKKIIKKINRLELRKKLTRQRENNSNICIM